jgi:hypothetical protein
MRRRHIQVFVTVLITVVLATTVVWWRSGSSVRYRKFAEALTMLHQQWETNSYHSPGAALPAPLQASPLAVARLNWALVQYPHSGLGIRWSSRYQIERTSPSAWTWKLYSIGFLEHPRIPWLYWKRELISVPNAQ